MKYASALVREGHPLDNIARMVEAARSRAGIIFSVSSMDTLRRSGRIGIIRQSVGTILNIRPVLLCEDGAISACGSARGSRELIHELTGHIPKDAKKIILQHLSDSCVNGTAGGGAAGVVPGGGILCGAGRPGDCNQYWAGCCWGVVDQISSKPSPGKT